MARLGGEASIVAGLGGHRVQGAVDEVLAGSVADALGGLPQPVRSEVSNGLVLADEFPHEPIRLLVKSPLPEMLAHVGSPRRMLSRRQSYPYILRVTGQQSQHQGFPFTIQSASALQGGRAKWSQGTSWELMVMLFVVYLSYCYLHIALCH